MAKERARGMMFHLFHERSVTAISECAHRRQYGIMGISVNEGGFSSRV
jgi:hypothetical protein